MPWPPVADPALEVTLRSAVGLKAIQILREQRPELVTGAGTVLDPQMLAAAEAAGSQFIVTPGITRDLLQASVASPIPLLPGISNASGIMEGYALGYRRFKLFPAEVSGGVAAIKALGGPFGEVKFCPTGGVGPANIKSYMALKNVMCVGGSWMLDPSGSRTATGRGSKSARPRPWPCWTEVQLIRWCVLRLYGALGRRTFFFAREKCRPCRPHAAIGLVGCSAGQRCAEGSAGGQLGQADDQAAGYAPGASPARGDANAGPEPCALADHREQVVVAQQSRPPGPAGPGGQ